jgi:hypothetical protein
MTERVIRKLRVLQGHGVITPALCIRAERYVERHPEIFGGRANLTVNQAASLALEQASTPHAGRQLLEPVIN